MARGKSVQTVQLTALAYSILAEIHPASVRAVAYQLFVRQRIPDMSKNSTNRVSRLLRDARENGVVPWEWIVDEGRKAERPGTWANPQAFARVAQRSYRKDRWQYQTRHVEVWSEKGTARGTLGPVLDQYGIAFRVMHGYSSATVAYDVAKESLDYEQKGQPFVALYLGDWDPSGLHMSEVDLPQRIAAYGGAVEVRRIALQSADLPGLPSFPLESKRRDARYQWYRDQFDRGGRCWEIDAMDPRHLRERVEAAIQDQIVDVDAWTRCANVEEAQQESLNTVLSHWSARYAEAN